MVMALKKAHVARCFCLVFTLFIPNQYLYVLCGVGFAAPITILMAPCIEHLTQKATKTIVIGLVIFAAAQNVQQRSLLMLVKATMGSRHK